MFRYPVVVGGGTPFLPPVTDDIPLELIETRTFGSRVIYERYGRASRDESDRHRRSSHQRPAGQRVRRADRPDALAVWLAPDGMAGRFEHFEARPGGSFRLVLTYADASAARGKSAADSDVVDARFVELVPGVRVIQQIEFVSEDPAFHGTMTMTWEVTGVDAGSRVEIRAEDVPDGIDAADHAAGLSSSLDNLAAYVER